MKEQTKNEMKIKLEENANETRNETLQRFEVIFSNKIHVYCDMNRR